MGKKSLLGMLLGMLLSVYDAMVIGNGGCCVKKTVGGVSYTLVTSEPTSKYGCKENCIYARDDQPGGNHFCFKAGNLESACNLDKDDGILFIGPSIYSRESQLFLYPSLRKADCMAPSFPFGNDPDGYSGYITRMTDDGPLFCGGSVDTRVSTERCFLLPQNGTWTETSPLPDGTAESSVVFAEGWWISGFSNSMAQATLLWDGSAWQDYVDLPKSLQLFCMTKINSTHVFLSGGYVNLAAQSSESYIYSHGAGFLQIANMTRKRNEHACGVLDGKFVVVEGGETTGVSEFFSLETMTWNDGPVVKYGSNPWRHRIVSQDGAMHLITEKNIFTLENADSKNVSDWAWEKSVDLEYEGDGSDAFLMKTEDCASWEV